MHNYHSELSLPPKNHPKTSKQDHQKSFKLHFLKRRVRLRYQWDFTLPSNLSSLILIPSKLQLHFYLSPMVVRDVEAIFAFPRLHPEG